MKESRANFCPPDQCIYTTHNSSLEDIIGQLISNDDAARDLSKPVSSKDTPKPRGNIEILLDDSKQIELHSPSNYGSVQSQPMQLTNNKLDKINKPELDQPYDILNDCLWPDKLKTQTEPLQLTSSKNKQKKDVKKKNRNVCEICDKKFTTSASAREHLKIHTGERPFKCSECDATFTTKSNLTTHKRMHSGERPFICGYCKKSFSQSSHLAMHVKTHTGESLRYDCDICGKKLSTKAALRNHTKNHLDDRPFVCGICNKKFACNAYLTDHQTVHSNERPYQCDVCKKSFKEKAYIAIHKRRFCNNNGYAKRWKAADVVKPPGRKRKTKKLNGPPRPRGRPKGRRKKGKKVKKKTIETDSDKEFEALLLEDEIPPKETPLELTSSSRNGASPPKSNLPKSVEMMNQYTLTDLPSHQSDHELDLSKPDECSGESFLDLPLSADVIFNNFAKPENLTLQHCFSEPQNLSLATNLPQSHCLRNNMSFQLSSTSQNDAFSQPQNLCLPQNLSLNHNHCQSPLQPQNLSLSNKITQDLSWDINAIDDTLSQPQNLSMPQNLHEPQNLTRPQNLSRTYNEVRHMPNMNQSCNSLNMSNIHNPTFGSPHVFAQPQNLSQSHSMEDSQPQNLSVPHMAFADMSQPMTDSLQSLGNIQPQNMTQSHMSDSMELSEPSTMHMLYYQS